MNIGILGAGAFGTALAKNLAQFSNTKHNVTLYSVNKDVCYDINNNHANSVFLPNISLPNNLIATNTVTDLYNCNLILLVTPVKFIRSVLNELTNYPKHIPLIIMSKGIEEETQDLVSDIIIETLGEIPIGVLTGPTFAVEIANNLVSALTLATKNLEMASTIIKQLNFSTIRIYKSTDVIGCQIGGAVKNVIAIAAGIIKGLNMSHNALAGLITRGVVEIATVIKAYNGNTSTAFGLSGLGDLVLTATSPESRNYSLGLAIAQANGYSTNIHKTKKGVAEGLFSAQSIHKIIQKHNLHLPICQEVYRIIYQQKKPTDSIKDILNNPIKAEFANISFNE